jgi:hypothetical protein
MEIKAEMVCVCTQNHHRLYDMNVPTNEQQLILNVDRDTTICHFGVVLCSGFLFDQLSSQT